MPIFIRSTREIRRRRPVAGGVPLSKGECPEGAHFTLLDDRGEGVPLQSSVLARWPDKSVRWVLLDAQATGREQGYTLSWGRDAESPIPAPAACAREDMHPEIDSGFVSVSWPEPGRLSVANRFDVIFSLAADDGSECLAIGEEAAVEARGPLRATLLVRGAFRKSDGGRVFQFRLRVSVFAGLSLVKLEPFILVDAEEGVIQRIHEIKLSLRTRGALRSVRIGGDNGWEGPARAAVRLFQYDDQHYRLEGVDGEGGQAPGWAEATDASGSVAVALRDFWQQWPKSIEAAPEGVSIGLLPRFKEGDFAHMGPWYKHQYFFDGNAYRLRTGQARRWEVWLDLEGDGESLAEYANAPLVLAADPAAAIASGVWDEIAPAGAPGMRDYDVWAENLFSGYCESIRVQRDYGAMNWGDWFGERHVNWGNHEYDTTNQILIQFARTGDPKYFYVADAAARHSSEVDTIHHVNDDLCRYFVDNFGCPGYPPRAGMVHEHSVGHVGSFYSIEVIRNLFVEHGVGAGSKTPYLCLDPYNLGHIWTQGLVRHYFLTGDSFLRETVEKIGNNLAQLVEDGEYKFIGHSHCGRTAGWSLLALAGAYELDFNDRYVRAMKTIVDAALEEQDPNRGGWLYSLPRGHCFCEKAKHVGMAGFITAILVNGLSRYYLLTGDDRLPQAIERAVTYLDNDTWREEWRDWRYTSCPASPATNRPGVVVMAHVNAVRIADNPEHLRVLQLAWEAKFKALLEAPPPGPGQGKAFSSKMYGCAEAVARLAARVREGQCVR